MRNIHINDKYQSAELTIVIFPQTFKSSKIFKTRLELSGMRQCDEINSTYSISTNILIRSPP